jgi:hypothetical protein
MEGEEGKKSKRPSDNALKQQRLKAYQPIPTIKSSLICFTTLFVLFLIFGLAMYMSALSVVESSERYDSDCDKKIGSSCTITFDVDDDMTEPVYVYYEMRNFYQNHRAFVKSRSEKQLRGEDIDKEDLDKDCIPAVTYDELFEYVNPDPLLLAAAILADSDITDLASYMEEMEDDVAFPCGLAAATKFNDTYVLTDPKGKLVKIDEDDIAWESDKDFKFENLDGNDVVKRQWTDIEDEHFIVWMRLAALPTFRKLWGKIESDVDEGTYSLTI